MNRSTGEVLWRSEAIHGFIHNAIAVGSSKIFCLDKTPPFTEEQMQRRGLPIPDTYNLRTFDIKTGKATDSPACDQLEMYPVREIEGSLYIGLPK
jgi:hypothetical protein